ncbi:MAG: 30S ribosomal protein S20 [Chloroflexi bacterium]|nr:30S ribosomal protein S20 [Chloroflexota bacterium]
MATTRSAKKAARVALRKRARNKPVKTALKTYVSAAEKLIKSRDVENAQAATASAIRALDKAAEKMIVHPNNAARKKSRLMKKLNQAKAAPKKA